MTSLRADQTVRKDHPQIEFRGVLDGAMADVAYGAALAYQESKPELADALVQLNACLSQVMRAHVMDGPCDITELWGRSLEELHAVSHDPKAHFGFGFFLPAPSHGPAINWLNVIRTRIRDAERAYIGSCALPNTSVCLVLNRLSSAVFVLMCEANLQFVQSL